jgi:hypothetical protein
VNLKAGTVVLVNTTMSRPHMIRYAATPVGGAYGIM